MFFTSCENELPEELFYIEETPDITNQSYTLSDVDYFVLELYKLNPNPTTVPGVPANDPYNELLPYDIRLEKGEVLRLEGLEPGYYRLIGKAWNINENFDPAAYEAFPIAQNEERYIVGAVSGKSDRMYYFDANNTNYIIVEEYSPVIIKLVFTGDTNIP